MVDDEVSPMKILNSFCRIAETEYALSTDKVNLLYYHLPLHFQGEYRSYDTPRLGTILQGAKDVRINHSEQFTYRKDQFVLLPPHASVYMTMPQETRALVYEFSDVLLNEVNSKVCESLEVQPARQPPEYSQFHVEKLDGRLLELHERTQLIVSGDDVNLNFLLDLICQEMVYELLKRQCCYDILSYHKNHPINRAIQLMRSAQGQSMSISDLAEEVSMSLPGFSQKFKLVTGQSPKGYMTKLRLHQSKHYLDHMSVTDTALELGYENISHFIRLFKKEYGVTPKQFKLSRERRL